MLRENIQNALKEAMKNKNTLETNAIRMIIAGQKEKDVDGERPRNRHDRRGGG